MRTKLLASLILGSALLSLPAASQAPDIGVAASITNKVDGTVGQQSKPIVIGDRVYQNEVIRTGVDSKGQLLFRDETTVTVGPESEITLDKFVYDPNGSSISMTATKGVFRFISGSAPKNAYEFKTPSATVGVRGTIFYHARLPDGTELWYATEGGIDVKTAFGPFLVGPGEILVIRPGQPPELGKLKPWQRALFAALLDPDKKSADIPSIPGMPDKGNDLRNLLRNNQEHIIDCYSDFAASYCYGFRRRN